MFIGCLRTNVFIPHSRSLKDKRQIVERIKSRIKNGFNVSMAEKPSDKWQVCELSIVCVNYTKGYVSEILDKVEEFIRMNADIHIVEIEKEIF
ncbi:MAG: DUF503 domain-containing protein [Candidatus Omnitrophica bacterium]|nr:DUF503 domain-containing protein [Candidatus Omnitrophota bacterium]MCM8826627.1 DUF503 domain-containing protein [Candidatus Omnitrophota bacterium]